MSDFERLMREEARLIILRALAEQPAGRLNSSLLSRALEAFGVTRTREWIHAEIRHLEQIGAVTAAEAGSVLVVQLTARGADHVERRAFLDGVQRPKLPGV